MAVDVGGTFVDAVAVMGRRELGRKKLLNEAGNSPTLVAAAIQELLHEIGLSSAAPVVLLSTTLGTNAMLEGKLPAIGLVVTRGFREILGVGRRAPIGGSIRASGSLPLSPVVPLELVREIGGRLDSDGSIIEPLDAEEIRSIARWYRAKGVHLIAVSLLHSYRNSFHECFVKTILETEVENIQVYLSSDLDRRASEYDRTVRTCTNAALTSVIASYLEELESEQRTQTNQAALFLMQNDGGLSGSRRARCRPLTTARSGSSAAVVGAAWLGRQLRCSELITVDMGGTSTDISLVAQHHPQLKLVGSLNEPPSLDLVVDVSSIAAGGGSVAWWSPDGRLNVGPCSAGAMPGPACYARSGDDVTVTDAHLALGRLPEALLGGSFPLDKHAAMQALERFAEEQNRDYHNVAAGIVRITTHRICAAIRELMARSGMELRTHSLVLMGGAGPLHAAFLADLLKLDCVLVPRRPGLASVSGLLAADFRTSRVQGLMQRIEQIDLTLIGRILSDLQTTVIQDLLKEGVPPDRMTIQRTIDFHYLQMSAELTVALPDCELTPHDFDMSVRRFQDQFVSSFRYSRQGEPIEVTNLRVIGVGTLDRMEPETISPHGAAIPAYWREAHFVENGQSCWCPIYTRKGLGAKTELYGPAILEQYDSTVVVPPGWRGAVDQMGNLLLERSH